ncbi:MAG: hypothetical protein V1910_01555 [bacterium]
MFTIKKSPNNPLLSPNTNNPWEAKAVFNWCPIKDKNKIHYIYRAMSSTESYFGNNISISSIGYTSSKMVFIFQKENSSLLLNMNGKNMVARTQKLQK